METIFSAIISAASAIAVCVINNNKIISLIEYRLQQLEKKQDRYNNVISRTYDLEKSEELFEKEFQVINHRLHDLEDFHKG